MYNIRRRNGWQRPLHPLQMLGMALYTLLIVAFYCFISPFLGNRIANIIILTTFTSLGVSVMVLFIRCTATDPSDNHHRKTRKLKQHNNNNNNKSLNYGFLIVTTFRRIERKILKTWIKRKYPTTMLLVSDQLLPFPLITSPDDSSSVSPEPICFFKDDQAQDISFCSLCNFEVKKHSKHCRTCNRCVEGFDHHCRWLNNCVGKKNYTTFVLLMISLLLMLMMEGGTSVAVFIRCFADKKHIDQELSRQFHARFPRGLLAAISVVLVLVTGYGSAALAQLFLFHLLLIRKGMRTYDYILAMKAENQFSLDLLDDSDFSSDDDDDDDDSSSNPPSPTSSIDMCKQQRPNLFPQSPGRLSVRIDPDNSNLNHNKAFRAGIDPWTLIQMSREKAFMATQKAKERLAKEKQTVTVGNVSLNPLPLEMKSGPLINSDENLNIAGLSLTPLIATGRFLGSPGRFSSPRRRFSGSPATLPNQTYKSNFDLKLTEVSQELESYISRQVLSTVLKDGTEASPR